MRAVPRLCKFYPGICLTTKEKARKTLSQSKKNLSQGKKNLSQMSAYYKITGKGKGKGKVDPRTGHEGSEME